MKDVNIYIATTVKNPKRLNGEGIYVLEMPTGKGDVTLTGKVALEEVSCNEAALKTLGAAVESLKMACNLTIYTDNPYIAGAFDQGWVQQWEKNGWKNAKGEEIAGKDEWAKIRINTKCGGVLTALKEDHKYKKWMAFELGRKGVHNV